MLQAVRQLNQVNPCLCLRLRAVLFNDMHQVTTRAELKHQVDVSLCGLDLVEAHDIRVFDRLQDRDLCLQVLLQLAVQLCSNDLLDSNHPTHASVLTPVHRCEGALADDTIQIILADPFEWLYCSPCRRVLHARGRWRRSSEGAAAVSRAYPSLTSNLLFPREPAVIVGAFAS